MTSSRKNSDYRPATLAAQAGGGHDPITGAVVPPMHASTTYARDADYALIGPDRVYSRPDNPTYDAVESLMTELEGGAASLAFASGIAAISAVIQALAGRDEAGRDGHVVIGRDLYSGTAALLETFKDAFGLTVDRVDTSDAAAVEAAMIPGRTRLVIVEPIANPTWAVTDIARMAEIAHQAGAVLAVDNTVLTPILYRPLDSGADLVIHSATKYLNGHSDVVAGVVTTGAKTALWQRIEAARRLSGAVLGPFEAWLLLRGMRTLSLRVREQTRAAETIARRFDGDHRVAQVLYPTLTDGAQLETAQRQFPEGCGGMLSLRVAAAAGRSPRETALATIGATTLFVRATSLGGVESLIEHRWTVEGGTTGVPEDLLRVSVGIEDVDDLIADLDRALAIAHQRP